MAEKGRPYPVEVIVDEPVRGSFAYLEKPGLFAMPPAVDAGYGDEDAVALVKMLRN